MPNVHEELHLCRIGPRVQGFQFLALVLRLPPVIVVGNRHAKRGGKLAGDIQRVGLASRFVCGHGRRTA